VLVGFSIPSFPRLSLLLPFSSNLALGDDVGIETLTEIGADELRLGFRLPTFDDSDFASRLRLDGFNFSPSLQAWYCQGGVWSYLMKSTVLAPCGPRGSCE
jgi:hypothetical protein